MFRPTDETVHTRILLLVTNCVLQVKVTDAHFVYEGTVRAKLLFKVNVDYAVALVMWLTTSKLVSVFSMQGDEST
jgi:hypothetical protein